MNLKKFGRLSLFALVLGAAAGCTPMNRPAHSAPSAEVPVDAARVVVAFPQGFPFGEVHVVEGDHLLGYLRNKQHFVVDLPPGEHTLMLLGHNEEAMKGYFLPGKTYHFRVFLTPGAFGARTYWKPLEASGEELKARTEDLSESTLVELEPKKAKSWEDDSAEENLEYSEEFRSGEEAPVTFTEVHAL